MDAVASAPLEVFRNAWEELERRKAADDVVKAAVRYASAFNTLQREVSPAAASTRNARHRELLDAVKAMGRRHD